MAIRAAALTSLLLLTACAGGETGEVIDKSCQEHADCPGSQVCDNVKKVCVSLACASDDDCASGQRCLADGTCKVAECETDAECCAGASSDCALTCVDFQCTGSECEAGQSKRCFVGCHEGTQSCEKGVFTPCSAPPVEAEVCGDSIDNDCNGQTDEQCAVCGPGDTRVCTGPCGDGQQRCTDAGQWDACDAPNDCSCEQGQTTTQACGMCGELAGTCGPDDTWIFSTLCTGEGACSVGMADSQPCGQCGFQTRTCNVDCTWGEWTECSGQGVCEPEESELQDCGNCGQQQRICSATCEWSDWSACNEGQGCEMDDTQTKSCGLCGVQVSTCNASCQWSPFGTCQDQGVCQPNQIQVEDCGFCGERQRTCNGDCEWGAWSSCSGAGVCDPGDTESQSCGPSSSQGICEKGTQVRTCNNACKWNTWGSCLGATYPKSEICGNGVDEDCNGSDKVQPDSYEDNDTCGTCYHLGQDPNKSLNATFDNPSDTRDFYCFDAIDNNSVPGFEESIKIDLIDQDLGVDADIFLYKGTAKCQAADPLASSVTIGSDDEHIHWGGSIGSDDGGLYIIEVRSYEDTGCTKGYTLKVNGFN